MKHITNYYIQIVIYDMVSNDYVSMTMIVAVTLTRKEDLKKNISMQLKC